MFSKSPITWKQAEEGGAGAGGKDPAAALPTPRRCSLVLGRGLVDDVCRRGQFEVRESHTLGSIGGRDELAPRHLQNVVLSAALLGL